MIRDLPTIRADGLHSGGTPVHGAEHQMSMTTAQPNHSPLSPIAPVRPPRNPDGSRLSSVASSIRLLKAFSEEQVEIGISDLAKRLGVAKSTVHRLAVT